jgi:hypothetical protein
MAAQVNQPPRAIGIPPEPYDGSPDKATPFWNTLASYYSLNEQIYATEGRRVAAALTHFQLSTPAGAWASDRLATAMAATPPNYGTWQQFEDAFKAQFIPPATQLEAITKMHNLPMGQQDFNAWYLNWSMHARRANVDAATTMYAFRKNLNPVLHNKIISLSPQPTTLEELVTQARNLDNNWRMFAPTRSNPRGNTRIREVTTTSTEKSTDIAATQTRRTPFKKRGKLTPEERQHRVDNNLCLYCGKGGHVASDCKAAPNKRPYPPKASLRQVTGSQTKETEDQQTDSEINAVTNNRFLPLLGIPEEDEAGLLQSNF